MPFKKHITKKRVYSALGICGVILISCTLTYFITRPRMDAKPTTPAALAQSENEQIINTVRSLVIVPEEQPTVATIQNKETLADQPFFQSAENGDKVLYFPTAKKAVLYRPTLNRVVDMSSVEVAPSGPTPTPILTLTTSVNLAIINGTATPKQATIMEQVVTGILPTTKVVTKGNAVNQDPGYDKTLIVNLTDQNETVMTTIANAIGAQISKLPTGEVKPDGDVLIIIGKDFVQKSQTNQ